jgi:hypothetical protein
MRASGAPGKNHRDGRDTNARAKKESHRSWWKTGTTVACDDTAKLRMSL